MGVTIRRVNLISLCTCLFLVSTVLSAQEPKQQAKTNTTLLIIDIQNFYFPNGALPLSGIEKAAKRAQIILTVFRRLNFPVVHVKHLPTREGINPEDPQWAINVVVKPTSKEKVFIKRHVNCFRDTKLMETLQSLGTQKLIIVGMQTHMCIEAAVRAAADLGIDVTLVHDACAARDITYGDTIIPAKQVHEGTLASLKDIYAKLVSTKELIRQMRPIQVSDKQK